MKILLAALTLAYGLAQGAQSLSPKEARAIARDAYIYGYPLVDNYRVQYSYFVDKSTPEYKGAWNAVHNTARVYTPNDKTIQTPNSDTPYSALGADLRTEPLVISVPAVEKGRYYSLQFIDWYTFNVDYVGSRATGNGGGNYLLAGPGWKGMAPKGIKRVIRSETPFAFVLYRTQLFNPADIENVKAVQAGYQAQPLSQFLGKPAPTAVPPVDFRKPLTREEQRGSLAFFDLLNWVLQLTPTHPSEKALMARFGKLGIGAGKTFDPQTLSPEVRQAVEDGVADAWKAMDDHKQLVAAGKASSDMAGTRAHYKNNYLNRFVVDNLGIYANSREEAFYAVYLSDSTDQALQGSNRYALRFPPGQLPPANAFWSITMYELPTSLLYANPLNRYLINSPMLSGLQKDLDGGLTLYVQNESPGADKESNWLPAPKAAFFAVLRVYWPKREALNGSWTQPPLHQVAFPASAQAGPVALDKELRPWTGDFDKMLERRMVRVLVPYSRTLYFNDKGAQRGLTADSLKDFEIWLNEKYKLKNRPFTVVALPTTREALLPGLRDGTGDIAAGNLTITEDRAKRVDFSDPIRKGVVEVVVTGPASPALASLDDLAGQTVHVRRSSSYYDSLTRLNKRFRTERREEMKLVLVPDALEDEDMMEMLGAGLLQIIVVDDWKAQIWAQLVPHIQPRAGLALSEPSNIAWAFRKNSPKLAAAVNQFIRTHPGSFAARYKAYPGYLKEVRNATADADWQRFEKTIALFRKYGERYSFDYLMVAALGYQESKLNQNARSHVGAIGIMQLMPETGRSLKVGDITKAEPNVHGGFKYLRQIYDQHLNATALDEQNRTLFAIAAYNCGSGRVASLRAEAATKGLDPNVWFNNVELIAAQRVGQETVVYVRNIYKYYVAYKLQLETLEARRAASLKVGLPKK
jgi:membrane-bound lytic murein transglycosylase MltF